MNDPGTGSTTADEAPSEQEFRPRGTVRILTWFGIPVFLHWSWGVVALIQLQWRSDAYGGSMLWIAAEYLGLFALVLLHEFGHALACRSVGGTVSHVLLWPLGGVAHVRPPQRAGALLWSIVAGPLVNLVLGILSFAALLGVSAVAAGVWPNLELVLMSLTGLNIVLFVFNMLPIHPLDGGQIVRALLWFVIGRERSLIWTSATGIAAGVVGGLAAWFFLGDYWLPLIAAYAVWRSYQSLRAATAMSVLLSSPRHERAKCPSCGESPPIGAFWMCPNGHRFDAFAGDGSCVACNTKITATPCIVCMETNLVADYLPNARVPVPGEGQ